MFATLIESGGSKKRQTRWLPASAAIHLVLIAIAIVYSAPAHSRTVEVHDEPDLVWIAPQRIDRSPAQPAGGSAGQATSTVADRGILPPLSNVPPFELPEISSRLGGMDGIADPSMSPSGGFGPDSESGGSATGAASGLRSAAHVDRVALPHSGNRPPEYPRTLRAAGIEGSVTVRFVIDTTGVIEPGSPVVVRSDHPLFTAAVLRALSSHRFLPAEAGGRRVRMLAERRFEFAITGP